MSIRDANLVRKWRPCLKCGRLIRTDRCHRLCVACSHRNDGVLDRRGPVPHELAPVLRGILTVDCAQPDMVAAPACLCD